MILYLNIVSGDDFAAILFHPGKDLSSSAISIAAVVLAFMIKMHLCICPIQNFIVHIGNQSTRLIKYRFLDRGTVLFVLCSV